MKLCNELIKMIVEEFRSEPQLVRYLVLLACVGYYAGFAAGKAYLGLH